MNLRKVEHESVNWIHMSQDTDRWQFLVKFGMKIWVSCKRWIFRPKERVSASQEGRFYAIISVLVCMNED